MTPDSPRPKGPLAWMVTNNVAANLVMLVFLVGGLIVGLNIKQEVFPDFALDIVKVSVSYPGASPEDVEEGVILAVEEAIQNVEGIKEVSSTASEGVGSVSVEALEGADVTRMWQEISSEVDRIETFPDEAKEPKVSIASRRRPVLSLALYGVDDELVLREAAEEVRDELLQDPDITQVELEGARDYEIHIEISQKDLRRFGLTLGDVARTVGLASVDLGGGSLKTPGGDVIIRVKDRRETAEEYARLPLLSKQGGDRILLGDVGRVTQGFEESDTWAGYNGGPAVSIEVFRVGDQTPIQVADAGKRVIERLNQELPANLKVAVSRDRSDIFRQRADLLLRNAYLGLGLVFVCLALFLEARLAFWVSLGIPISFLGSFLFLSMTSFSLNMITMFAFIVTLGIVVDDAIVVGENIYSHRKKGESRVNAAVSGVGEVIMPVTFSVITNMVAFLPMFFIPGTMGKIFKFIPMVVVAVFAVSLIESLFVLPAHLAHAGRHRGGPMAPLARLQERFSKWFEGAVRRRFGAFLDLGLNHRYLVLAVGLALLMASAGYVRSGRMGLELFPRVESDYAFVEAQLPSGSSTAMVKGLEKRFFDAAMKVVERLGGDDLYTGILTVVQGDSVQARLYLTSPEVRPASTAEVTEAWREEVGRVAGVESIEFMSDRGGPGSGKALTVQLSHRNKEILDLAGVELAARLEEFAGVSDIDDGSARGKSQLDVTLLPAGERMGLTSREVANQVRHSFYGAEALKLLDGRNEVTVRVWLPEDERNNLDTVEELVLLAPRGEILLRDAARITPGRAYTSIQRKDGRRIIEVSANVTPRPKTEQILRDLKASILPELVQRRPGLTYSFEGRQADIRESLQSLFRGLALALLALYGLLAVPFRSYTQPLVIMFCIPFAMIGAFLGHLLLGYSLSVMSMFGMVALSGVVINDSLVLIDFANRRRRNGMEPREAVHDAAIRRFRPILLTTLTTFGGLAPMIFETSRQARFLIPMAVSLGFGLLFATVVMLVLVPSVYIILEDISLLIRRLFGASGRP